MYYITYNQGSASWLILSGKIKEESYRFNTSIYEKWCTRGSKDKYYNGCKLGYKTLNCDLYDSIVLELKIVDVHG